MNAHAGANMASETSRWGLVACCMAVMMAEGFDLLVYGNAIPALLADPAIGIDRSDAGLIGSMVFAGMLLGGLLAGKAVAAFGLARVALGGIIAFSVATAAIALARSGTHIGGLRLLAGLALGLVLPTVLALARSFVQPRHGAMAITIVMAGLPVGGMLAALVALQLVPAGGWRPLFVAGGLLGAVPLLLVAPALRRVRDSRVVAVAASPGEWRAVFNTRAKPVLAIGALATLADLLAWYGITTWLVQLMREFDVPFDGALQLMFTLSIGAIVGSLGAAALAMRLGTRPVAIACGVVAALCLLAIAARALPPWALFAVVAVLGMAAISAQNLVNALVADAFPASHRAAAMGVTLGIGRLGAVAAPIVGGQILAAGQGPSWVLAAFAIAALAGAALLLPLNRQRMQACENSLS